MPKTLDLTGQIFKTWKAIKRYLTREFSDLKKEVDKCILVCSNCHAEIHDKEEQDKINN